MWTARFHVAWLLPLVLGCGSEEAANGPCDELVYATPPSGAIRYVGRCEGTAATGTAHAPLLSISEAAAEVGPGGSVLVASGTYDENVELPGGVALIGSSAEIRPTSGVAVTVTGPGTTLIRGMRVVGSAGGGIISAGADLRIEDCAIDDTRASTEGPGHGVQVTDGALEVVRTRVTNGAGVGIVAARVTGVLLQDPDFGGDPRAALDRDGLVEPSFLSSATTISGNQGGGVALVDPVVPTSAVAIIYPTFSLKLDGVDIVANGGYGVASFGGSVDVRRSAIRGTTRTGDFGDGIIIAPGSGASFPDVVVDASSTVSGNDRAGMLVAASAKATVDGELAFNGLGGLWLQSASAGIVGPAAWIRGNRLVGAVATADCSLEVKGARVDATQLAPYDKPGGGAFGEIGDGISAFEGAVLVVEGATLTGNERAAILIEGTDNATVHATSIAESVTGIALQKVEPSTVDLKDNSFTATTADVKETSFVVQSDRCDGAPACQPAPP